MFTLCQIIVNFTVHFTERKKVKFNDKKNSLSYFQKQNLNGK